MTFWEALGLIGFGAAVLGAWLLAASYYDGWRTRALMRELAQRAEQRHKDIQAMTRDLIREKQSETRVLPERMQERADDHHRKAIR